MLLCLLRASVIWGLSLLLFRGLFRKETFHGWNRLYLLLTLAGGLLLPLWPVHAPASIAAPVLEPVRALAARQAVLQQAPAVSNAARGTDWLLLIWCCGAAIAGGRIAAELVRLVARCRRGRRSAAGRFTLIETGRAEAPYSFFRLIFISGRNDYTPAELEMVLGHEQRHARLGHSLDLLLLQSLQVVLWFHPLLYIYRHYLQLVHEYEADDPARNAPAAYGRFLLEQTLLYRHRPVTHAFFHSPIKNRIMMLTKASSAKAKRARYLAVLPMSLLFVLVCATSGFSHEKVRKGNKETFKGNVFEYAGPDKEGRIRNDKNHEEMTVVFIGEPERMNGEKIYGDKEVSRTPVFTGPGKDAVGVIFDRIHGQLNTLEDGEYHMAVFSPVISRSGEVVYYNVRGIEGPGWPAGEPVHKSSVPPALQQQLVREIEAALDEMRFRPAESGGRKVHAYLNNDPFFNRKIIVKGHQARLQS